MKRKLEKTKGKKVQKVEDLRPRRMTADEAKSVKGGALTADKKIQ